MHETFNVGSTTTKSESESSKAEDDKVGNNSERCICEAKFNDLQKGEGEVHYAAESALSHPMLQVQKKYHVAKVLFHKQ